MIIDSRQSLPPLFLTVPRADGNIKNCSGSDINFCVRLAGEVERRSHVPKWRNWQTRYIQGVVPVRAWRFESSLRHQIR